MDRISIYPLPFYYLCEGKKLVQTGTRVSLTKIDSCFQHLVNGRLRSVSPWRLGNTSHPVNWKWGPATHLLFKGTVPKNCVTLKWHINNSPTASTACSISGQIWSIASALLLRSFLTPLVTSAKDQAPLKRPALPPEKTPYVGKSWECSFQLPTMSPVKVCIKLPPLSYLVDVLTPTS